jgi:gas vesicle protein
MDDLGNEVGSRIGYFVAGAGLGILVGILFAPRSGQETRDYLSQKADQGKDLAQRKARELRVRAGDLAGRGRDVLDRSNDVLDRGRKMIDRGKEIIGRQGETISQAVEAGRAAYDSDVSSSSQ